MFKKHLNQLRLLRLLIPVTILMLIPIFGWIYVSRYYAFYDSLAQQFECYPIESCHIDLNSDSVFDKIGVTAEPRFDDPHHLRLKVLIHDKGNEREVLNIENFHQDGSFRTHLAYLRANGVHKIVIYDTVNPNQFFTWNGSQLIPNEHPSEAEFDIRRSLALKDDTGGFHTRIFLESGYFVISGVYYISLFLAGAILLVARRRYRLGLQ